MLDNEPMSRIFLEAACGSLEEAIAADELGLDRIELCTGLSGGGVTPSIGLVEAVLARVSIPVNVMIRPREGNFCFSQDELSLMARDIQLMRDLGVAGIVTGVANHDGSLCRDGFSRLMDASDRTSVICHRSIDTDPERQDSIAWLADQGCQGVLTSGGVGNAQDFKAEIAETLALQSDRFQVIVGGGITAESLAHFVGVPLKWLHFSVSRLDMSEGYLASGHPVLDRDKISKIKQAVLRF